MRLISPPPSPAFQTQRQGGSSFSELAKVLDKLQSAMNFTVSKDAKAPKDWYTRVENLKQKARRLKKQLSSLPTALEQRYNQLMNQKTILSPKITKSNVQGKPSVVKKPSISERIERLKKQIAIQSAQASKNTDPDQSRFLSLGIVDLTKQLNFLIPRKK